MNDKVRIWVTIVGLVVVCAGVIVYDTKSDSGDGSSSDVNLSDTVDKVNAEEEDKEVAKEESSEREVEIPDNIEPLPEVDISLLEPLTVKGIAQHYEEVMMKQPPVSEEQFKFLLTEEFAVNLLEGVQRLIVDEPLEETEAVEMYLTSFMMMNYIFQSGIYTQEELTKTSWVALFTAMSMLESHTTDFQDYPVRKATEINHLGTLLTYLLADENFEKLGYTLSDEVHTAMSEMIISEEFNKAFSKAVNEIKANDASR